MHGVRQSCFSHGLSSPIAALLRRLLADGHCSSGDTLTLGVDLNRVEEVALHLAQRGPDWKVLLVGPSQGTGVLAPIIRRLSRYSNIEVRDPMPLDALQLEETLAALLPYRRWSITDAVTLANKSMQLLARGPPLLISAMPRYLEAPFVIRLDGSGGCSDAVSAAVERFDALQEPIADYCVANALELRLRMLLGK